MFSNGQLDVEHANFINAKINNIKQTFEDPLLQTLKDFISMGLPLVPYPRVEECLGLKSRDSVMRIQEGYAIMAFDYDIVSSHAGCLFDMQETLKQKELRLAQQEAAKQRPENAFSMEELLDKMKEQAK